MKKYGMVKIEVLILIYFKKLIKELEQLKKDFGTFTVNLLDKSKKYKRFKSI
jgi:hypothetical protein